MRRLLFVVFWMVPAAAMAGRVMVIPFGGLSPADRQADLAPGITHAIQIEITRISAMTFVAPRSPIDGHIGIEAACALARQSSADHVVLGSYQTSPTQIRASGYVIRASDARIIATLKATNETADLFALQDALAEQVQRALLRANPPATAPIAAASSHTAVDSIEFTGPVRSARVEFYTPSQWQSAQQKRLAGTAEVSHRRWPAWSWRYAYYRWPYHGHLSPYWIP